MDESQVRLDSVQRFATDPSTIISPPAATNSATNDNRLETLWTAASTLGTVQLISHPSGALSAAAAEVATKLRKGFSVSRIASYSATGREVTLSDRILGSTLCDFVGYADGRSNYIASQRAVFSKDFSGCLMVVYTQNGERRVAHSAASQVPTMDCKQAFLTTLRTNGATLGGWFRPFVLADSDAKADAFRVISTHAGGDPNRMTTFGVISSTGQQYAIDAFKPVAAAGNDWIVTAVRTPQMYTTWTIA
jgi:hypothetical protein